MARTRFTVEQIIGKLREAGLRLGQGEAVTQVCRSFAVTEQTYYLYGRPSRCKTVRR